MILFSYCGQLEIIIWHIVLQSTMASLRVVLINREAESNSYRKQGLAFKLESKGVGGEGRRRSVFSRQLSKADAKKQNKHNVGLCVLKSSSRSTEDYFCQSLGFLEAEPLYTWFCHSVRSH